MNQLYLKYLIPFLITMSFCSAENILMVTMGASKSHKIPFWELSRGLISRDHNITFLSGFPSDFHLEGLVEIAPAKLVEFFRSYTNWDLVGRRMKNLLPISLYDSVRFSIEACGALLDDEEIKHLLNRTFDLMILDGTYPECFLGIQYIYKIPFMYLNTVGFHTISISRAGSPQPYSITPNVLVALTDDMNFMQRVENSLTHVFLDTITTILMTILTSVLRRHLSDEIPHVYSISKNVSFILQNSHFSVSYPRPYMPNVAEIACIHCRAAQPLPKDLEDFLSGDGDQGFIYVSMGSLVREANMPESLRQLFVETFAKLPYRVLWKYDSTSIQNDLPSNVMISSWLPQQDVLGHEKLKLFITHGGLLSMYETVYHGVPIIVMPVFIDHDVNSEKARLDGYAYKLHLETLTSEQLLKAINTVIHDPQYRAAARYRQSLLRNQRTSPLETAVYWTEYVLRHKGAYLLQTPGRNMGFIQYYSLDVLCFFIVIFLFLIFLIKRCLKRASCIRTEKIKIQ